MNIADLPLMNFHELIKQETVEEHNGQFWQPHIHTIDIPPLGTSPDTPPHATGTWGLNKSKPAVSVRHRVQILVSFKNATPDVELTCAVGILGVETPDLRELIKQSPEKLVDIYYKDVLRINDDGEIIGNEEEIDDSPASYSPPPPLPPHIPREETIPYTAVEAPPISYTNIFQHSQAELDLPPFEAIALDQNSQTTINSVEQGMQDFDLNDQVQVYAEKQRLLTDLFNTNNNIPINGQLPLVEGVDGIKDLDDEYRSHEKYLQG